jgi:hypothetical protein
MGSRLAELRGITALSGLMLLFCDNGHPYPNRAATSLSQAIRWEPLFARLGSAASCHRVVKTDGSISLGIVELAVT